jgi:spermidine/putrescine transport system ATP-binding protein
MARIQSGNKPDSETAATTLTSDFRCVTKRFGEVVATDRIDLRISAGEFLSLLGPSGCGKTTALRMIAGFEQPSEGDVLIAGETVNGVPAYRRPCAFQSGCRHTNRPITPRRH